MRTAYLAVRLLAILLLLLRRRLLRLLRLPLQVPLLQLLLLGPVLLHVPRERVVAQRVARLLRRRALQLPRLLCRPVLHRLLPRPAAAAGRQPVSGAGREASAGRKQASRARAQIDKAGTWLNKRCPRDDPAGPVGLAASLPTKRVAPAVRTSFCPASPSCTHGCTPATPRRTCVPSPGRAAAASAPPPPAGAARQSWPAGRARRGASATSPTAASGSSPPPGAAPARPAGS